MISDAQFSAWLAADGEAREVLIEVGVNSAGAELTRRLSIYGYTTGSADVPAHTPYLARLKGGISFSRRIGITSTDAAVSVSSAEFSVDNSDGALNGWLQDVWEKRAIRAWIGSPSWPRADFRPLFAGRVAGCKPQSRTVIKISAYDELQRLNYPVSKALLGGAGDNKNALLPVCFGEPFFVAPLLVDAATHTYQYHQGAAAGVVEVQDIGTPITTWTSNAAAGKFSLTAAPIGAITCLPMGALRDGVYLHTLAPLVRELVTRWGDADLRLSDAEIDAANFAAFAAANPADLALYISDQTRVLDACNQLCRSLSASLYFGRTGLLRLWRMPTLAEVMAAVPVATLGPDDMRAGSFAPIDVVPDQPAVNVGFARNYTPVQSGLAGGLPEPSLAELAKEYEEAKASDAMRTTLHRYTGAPEREDTCLINADDADAEKARRLELRRQRTVVRFEGFAPLFKRDLGDVVRVWHPALGSGQLHRAVVVGVDDDVASGSGTLELLIYGADE